MSEDKTPRKRWELPVAVQKGPGAHERFISKTREGIKLEIAMRLYSELIGRASQSNRLNEHNAAAYAEQSFKLAVAFLESWDHQNYVQ